jgi:hypothetical protein
MAGTETIADLAATLHTEGERTITTFRALSEPAWGVTVYQDPMIWTPRHILVHLIEAENNFRLIYQDAQINGKGIPEGYDIDAHNAEAVPRLMSELSSFDTDQLIERFWAGRLEMIQLVTASPEPFLDHPVRHPMLGMTTIRDFLRAVYLHCKIHGKDVKRAVSD